MKNFKRLEEVVAYIMDGEETTAYRWNNDGGDWNIEDIRTNAPMYDEQYSGYSVDIETYDIYNADGTEKLFARIEDVTVYQVTEWFMGGENGEVAGTFADLEDARTCVQKCIKRARKTEKERKESYIDICPLLDDESLGDPVETYRYE